MWVGNVTLQTVHDKWVFHNGLWQSSTSIIKLKGSCIGTKHIQTGKLRRCHNAAFILGKSTEAWDTTSGQKAKDFTLSTTHRWERWNKGSHWWFTFKRDQTEPPPTTYKTISKPEATLEKLLKDGMKRTWAFLSTSSGHPCPFQNCSQWPHTEKIGKRISAESSLLSPLWPNQSRDWIEVNWST